MKIQLLVLAISLGVSLSASAAQSKLDTIAFMQGCWGHTDEMGVKVTEDWFKKTNGLMLGVSQTVDNQNSMIQYEFLEIKWDEVTDKIGYTPFLDGRKLNTFILSEDSSSSSTHTAVFSDPNNATLKTITYSLKDTDTLSVRLAGNKKTGESFEFANEYKRESCASRF